MLVIIRDVILLAGYFTLFVVSGERIAVRPSVIGKATTFTDNGAQPLAGVRTVDDQSWMWRPIDVARLAARLRLPLATVAAEGFFAELLPADRAVPA